MVTHIGSRQNMRFYYRKRNKSRLSVKIIENQQTNTRFSADIADKLQMQVKRQLGLHVFGVIKGNIKMIALLRGVISTGENRIPKMSFCDEILEMPD